MSDDTYRVTVTVLNELGMHARAATQFVKLASQYPCEVSVEKEGQEVNGKSIMGVLMLVASRGSRITITTRGDRANEAGVALSQLVETRFGEEQ